MTRMGIATAALFMAASLAHGADDLAAIRWDVELSRPAAMPLELVRGETVNIEPRLLSYSAPVNLSNCTAVVLRYRSAEMTNYYAATGEVASATNGRLRVTWSPACEAPATNYAFTLAATMTNGLTLRVFGKIKLLDSVGTGDAMPAPRALTYIDWSAVENANPAAAPFLTEEADTLGSVLERGGASSATLTIQQGEGGTDETQITLSPDFGLSFYRELPVGERWAYMALTKNAGLGDWYLNLAGLPVGFYDSTGTPAQVLFGGGVGFDAITADKVGAVSTNAPVWIASTNSGSVITLTNHLERPQYVQATGAVSIAFAGLRPPQPMYLVVRGPDTLTFPPGTHFVGGASYQTNMANHFVIWMFGTNLFVNPCTTSED